MKLPTIGTVVHLRERRGQAEDWASVAQARGVSGQSHGPRPSMLLFSKVPFSKGTSALMLTYGCHLEGAVYKALVTDGGQPVSHDDDCAQAQPARHGGSGVRVCQGKVAGCAAQPWLVGVLRKICRAWLPVSAVKVLAPPPNLAAQVGTANQVPAQPVPWLTREKHHEGGTCPEKHFGKGVGIMVCQEGIHLVGMSGAQNIRGVHRCRRRGRPVWPARQPSWQSEATMQHRSGGRGGLRTVDSRSAQHRASRHLTTSVIQGTEKALFIIGCCHSCRTCGGRSRRQGEPTAGTARLRQSRQAAEKHPHPPAGCAYVQGNVRCKGFHVDGTALVRGGYEAERAVRPGGARQAGQGPTLCGYFMHLSR